MILNKINILTVLFIQLQLEGHISECFSLTNLTVPTVQDPRSDMHLHCSFEMGGEELYAVKWYKDDHEFFRYTPSGENMVMFPVKGVHVDSTRSVCTRTRCDLFLTNIKKPDSSGAYRCEVSSEAPAFRLASKTHNVKVVALPDKPPTIDGLKNVYSLGESLTATCTSGVGDPKPYLEFYLNKKKIPVTTESMYDQPYQSRIKMRLKLDEPKDFFIIGSNEIACVSKIVGLSSSEAPPLTTTQTFSLIDQNQIVNNQKFRWADPASMAISRSHSRGIPLVFCLCIVFNYLLQ